MAQILVVDDDKQIVTLVQRALSSEGHTVLAAYAAQEAIDILRARRPDALVLDINLPDMSGIEVCKYIRTHPHISSLRILFLTQRVEIADRIVGFEAGADDYLGKPFYAQELQYRIRALLRAAPHSSQESVLVSGPVRVDPSINLVQVEGVKVQLTPMEVRLLYYLVAHSGEAVSSQQLLERVWGYPAGVGSGSLVRMHILNLRGKIETDPRNPRLLRTLPKHGYVFCPSPDEQPSLPTDRSASETAAANDQKHGDRPRP